MTHLSGTIEIPYQWAPGPAVRAFLDGLALGRLLASRCPACEQVTVPASSYCACGADCPDAPIDVGPEGALTLVTVVHQAPELAPWPAPYTLGLVALDEADTPLLARIDGDAAVGRRVRPRFRTTPEGDFGDLECFEVIR